MAATWTATATVSVANRRDRPCANCVHTQLARAVVRSGQDVLADESGGPLILGREAVRGKSVDVYPLAGHVTKND